MDRVAPVLVKNTSSAVRRDRPRSRRSKVAASPYGLSVDTMGIPVRTAAGGIKGYAVTQRLHQMVCPLRDVRVCCDGRVKGLRR